MNTLFRLSLVALVAGYSGVVSAGDYTFSRVATSSEGQWEPDLVCGAAISDNGLVTYMSFGNTYTIITTDGQTTTTIRLPDYPSIVFPFMVTCPNSHGFIAYRNRSSGAIIASNGTTTKTIFTPPIYWPTEIVSTGASVPSINDSGTVAFQGFDGSGWSIFTSDGTSTPTKVSGDFAAFPVINNSGRIAYLAGASGSGYPSSAAIQDGTLSLSLLGTLSWPWFTPDMNNSGTVACVATVGGATKIVIGDGVSPTRYVDCSLYAGGFNTGVVLDGTSVGGCSINDSGDVAFLAGLDKSHFGVYTGANPLTDKVIATGDMLDGLRVEEVWFARDGLNNSGQIAFGAALSDGTQGIWVATPVPEPSTFVLLALGIIGLFAKCLLRTRTGRCRGIG
jgi:hypothetical protein